jgi:hypothetical protein
MRKRAILSVAAIVLTLGLVTLAGHWLSQSSGAVAAQEETADRTRVIEVTGQGSVSARPDIARVRLGVQTEGETAVNALDANNVRMQDVISATLEAGVAEEDVQTSGLSLQPVYEQTDDNQRQLTGYRANNDIEITVRDLDGLGNILDAAVSAGSNTIQSIRFEISDPRTLQEQAREAAMENAIAKATQLTNLADAELGEVLTIHETSTAPGPVFRAETEEALSAEAPVQPGTETINVTVRVSWRIE